MVTGTLLGMLFGLGGAAAMWSGWRAFVVAQVSAGGAS
jgi:hypothetical protein